MKQVVFLGAILFIAESSCQRFIQPTFRPPPRGPVIIRTVREALDEPLIYKEDNIEQIPGDHPYLLSNIDDVKLDSISRHGRSADDEPLWLYKGDVPRAPATGDHPVLPYYIDDVKMDPNRRYVRSVDSPSAKRGGGSHTTSSGSRDTGATHPGHNRRNTRQIRQQLPTDTIFRPDFPIDTFPRPQPRSHPIYARVARDVKFPTIPKPVLTVPVFNPHAQRKPWHTIKF